STDTLMIDTGSSNTWVGANKSHVKTRTGHDNGALATYGGTYFEREEFIDKFAFGPAFKDAINQSIGVAYSSSSVAPYYDGFLGLGPVGLTNGTIEGGGAIPAVSNNIFSPG
ncbi:hypothetical protein V8E55_008838, partial [Tylopilus felleus]